MENYQSPASDKKKFFLNPVKAVPAANKRILDKVMPVHQVIRFANQAFEKNKTVCIVIEQKMGPKAYTRSAVTGAFKTGVNTNRQIMFTSSDKKMTYLLIIDQILAIQLA
ncbi:Hypothetical protein Tpal_334 [Trichococcus palustris]|jgi:hypothetical protein|uniref:Uncharacterized protein n=1 Tax=Trichococcus palustris TaxID=140314 RepID=A0A143Y8F7_9LACT|nr:hypothetical protein [Trichococcus palustris]CZQ82573.1 Hypothetical protein Tpal_334 [Trichococcus palustris]SFK67653.1 hypothetical protein SAMN04488076_10342 [Trichococcus palustris]